MIRIYHARILTMQEDQEIFDGEIWISDHKIQYVGPENKEEAAKICLLYTSPSPRDRG